MHASKSASYRKSILVALVLTLFTVIEFFAALQFPNGVVIMFLLALIKSYCVVYYYMHINRLWSSEDGGH